MSINLRILKTTEPGFEAAFAQLLARTQTADPQIETRVRAILDDVRTRGELLKEITEFAEKLEDLPDKREILENMPNWLNENIEYSERMALFE